MNQLHMIHTLERIPDIPLAKGFSLRNYRPGDEPAWIEICKHGLLKPEDGMEAWNSAILSVPEIDPGKDVFFVCDEAGKPVATVTVYVNAEGSGRVHMVAARPEVKGNGIGAFMAAFALRRLEQRIPSAQCRMVGLNTDDWRVPAIVGYLRSGFQPVLYDVDMDKRWKAICDQLNMHGIRMLDENGNPTDIVL